MTHVADKISPALLVALYAGVSTVWWVAVPQLLRVRHPRLDERNPDHFRRMVRFHRLWGLVAVAVGLGLACLL